MEFRKVHRRGLSRTVCVIDQVDQHGPAGQRRPLTRDPGDRVRRFERKHPELAERIPKKELASYLNLSAETLSRLKQRGKI